VIPGLIRRFHEAKERGDAVVTIWGSGTPRREFLYVDDMADACVHVMELDWATYAANTKPMLSHINVGSGEDLSIRELAEAIGRTVGFKGRIQLDASKPDGTPRKLMNVDRLKALGWKPRVNLEEGLALAYRDFLKTSRL
jgi:GDP-L-fucose synthase